MRWQMVVGHIRFPHLPGLKLSITDPIPGWVNPRVNKETARGIADKNLTTYILAPPWFPPQADMLRASLYRVIAVAMC